MYNSDFFNTLFGNDDLFSPLPQTLYVKENVLEGVSLTTGTGSVVAEFVPNAMGGMTTHLGNGETATISENMYNGITIDRPGVENDIVGRKSIFGEQVFTQNGQHIGTLSPNMIGDGYQFTGPTGETMFSTSTAFNGTPQLDINNFSSSTPDFGATTAHTFDVGDYFSSVETISTQFSAADMGSPFDAMDSLDFFGML